MLVCFIFYQYGVKVPQQVCKCFPAITVTSPYGVEIPLLWCQDAKHVAFHNVINCETAELPSVKRLDCLGIWLTTPSPGTTVWCRDTNMVSKCKTLCFMRSMWCETANWYQ